MEFEPRICFAFDISDEEGFKKTRNCIIGGLTQFTDAMLSSGLSGFYRRCMAGRKSARGWFHTLEKGSIRYHAEGQIRAYPNLRKLNTGQLHRMQITFTTMRVVNSKNFNLDSGILPSHVNLIHLFAV